MQLAMVAADFSAGEADQLRRAMAAWKRKGGLEPFEKKLKEGMRRNGYSAEFADSIFRQILGFGEYGFPESHSASFALLAYVSSWLKHHHPAAFCAALLNSQPMGFYAPAQLVQDARRHGVEVRPADVACSSWDCTLEEGRSAWGCAWREDYPKRPQRELKMQNLIFPSRISPSGHSSTKRICAAWRPPARWLRSPAPALGALASGGR